MEVLRRDKNVATNVLHRNLIDRYSSRVLLFKNKTKNEDNIILTIKN